MAEKIAIVDPALEQSLGIIEGANGTLSNVGTDSVSAEDVAQAVIELGKVVARLSEADKPDGLPALERAYPDYGGLLKAGKSNGLIDKGLLQKLGIIAPTKALLRKEGIRRASTETLTRDYLSLGKSEEILPGDAECKLLPPNVAGVDLVSQIELHEDIITVRDEAAKKLNEGDEVSLEISEYQPPLGDPFDVINVQTEPMHVLRNRLIRDNLIKEAESGLGAFVGGEVISALHEEALDVAQIRIRYLAMLNRDTLAYVLRGLGFVAEKDLGGSMEWRYRIGMASGDRGLFVNAVSLDDGIEAGAFKAPTNAQNAARTKPDGLTDAKIESLLADVKARYAHAVRPKNLKDLSSENPDFKRNSPLIKRYLKAHGHGPVAKYLEDQEIVTRFWRKDSLPRPEDEILEEFQSNSRMTVEELLSTVPRAEIIEFETTVTGSEEYGQPPFYEMLRKGDFLDAWVDKGTWVHMSFCGHDLGLVGWKERYEYCLVDYIDFAKECGVVTERVYAQITGFAGGPKAPKANLRVFFAIDRANQQMVPVKKDAAEWGYDFDGA